NKNVGLGPLDEIQRNRQCSVEGSQTFEPLLYQNKTSHLVRICLILLTELNTFYLKYVLWVPPPHILCFLRLLFSILWGGPAIYEYFQYMDDPNCKRLGRQVWMLSSVIITELLIILKFGWNTVTKPLPRHVALFWLVAIVGLTLWTFWHFYITRWLFKMSKKTDQELLKQSESDHSHTD
ncbi:hypothetical protein X801_07972, partial [Opisthorchis viverrini]